jgi:hypothetical protein
VDLFTEVKKDLDARNRLGHESYGGPMEPHDGRDSLREAYEEALDLVMYLKKAIVERDGAGRAPVNSIARVTAVTGHCVK